MIVDITVQPKAITLPTDAKLLRRTREGLVKPARKHGVKRSVRICQPSHLYVSISVKD
jgi:hypothetical protein